MGQSLEEKIGSDAARAKFNSIRKRVKSQQFPVNIDNIWMSEHLTRRLYPTPVKEMRIGPIESYFSSLVTWEVHAHCRMEGIHKG